MKYIITLFVLILGISCNSSKDNDPHTYFGGEIINPKSNFVLLLKDDEVIDTLELDTNNRFLSAYHDMQEGLYTFKHGVEFQYVYIQPKDSILIRLNTWDFDESLVFSGIGGEKNELLINMFLKNEAEEDTMLEYFNLEEKEFQQKIDSLQNEKLIVFNEFENSEENISEGFKELSYVAINYPLYSLKEMYPLFYKRMHKDDHYPMLSDEFYSYRTQINYNNEELISFYPYQNYVINYLYNQSYQEKDHNSISSNLTYNVINETAKNISSEKFKNILLKRFVVNDFLKSESTCSISENTYKLFLNSCTNDEYKQQVTDLVNDSKAISNNKKLRDFIITSYNTNNNFSIQNIIKGKNAVLYFWSPEFISTEYLQKRITYLERKYPTILFVGINMNPTLNYDIKQEPHLSKLDISKQYNLPKNSEAHHFLTSKYPRTIIVNKNGIVENGFTYLDSRKLNGELNKLSLK